MTPRRAIGLLLLLFSLALIAPQLRSGTEMVRARNALSLGADVTEAELTWTPRQRPADYLTEQVAPSVYFVDVARQLRLHELPDDWSRALAISRHLLGSAPKLNGGAIQQNLRQTHERITVQGDGYCGDFVRVFTAIANAAGMSVRPWSFSFDGFGGHGHIWVEVWDGQRGDWALVDVFQNYYYTLDLPIPLSALQLRAALSSGDARLQLHRLNEDSPPGWAIEAKAWDYLLRGLPQWYLPWGNDVSTIDQSPGVRAVAGASRALESMAALALGVQPEVRLLVAPGNEHERDALRGVRDRLFAAAGIGLVGLCLVVWPSTRARAGRGASEAAADGWPRICVVGPLPPPSGGMANQCAQLLRLLSDEGARVELVRTNAPYRPAWIARVPLLRALFRLLPYLGRLWRVAGRSDVMHVLANSGWAWHLFAAPALWIGTLRGTPVIVNYRGGLADEFLAHAPRHVLSSLRGAALRVTPSDFLRRVFASYALNAEVIPNVIHLERFQPHQPRAFGDAPNVLVARNLEAIYGLDTAIHALAALRRHYPGATLTLAGSGPQRAELEALAQALGLAHAVRFAGRVAHAEMPKLYAQADVVLNPSTVDNMPNAVLEAQACGVPLVSTRVGGVADIVDDGVDGLLVPPAQPEEMASALQRLLDDSALAARLAQAGRARVAAYTWPQVRRQWLSAYRRACAMEVAT